MTFLTLLFFSTTKILPELQGIENVPQHMSESIFKEIENCIFRQSLEYRDLEEDNSSFGKTTEQNNTRVNQFILKEYFTLFGSFNLIKLKLSSYLKIYA